MWPNSQETADLVTFTEEILNGKLHFSCRVHCSEKCLSFSHFNHSNASKVKLNSPFPVSNILFLRIKILYECCVIFHKIFDWNVREVRHFSCVSCGWFDEPQRDYATRNCKTTTKRKLNFYNNTESSKGFERKPFRV